MKGLTNKHLHNANRGKNDEFYTQLTTIEQECFHYKHHFKDKIIFLNCDDPETSMFWIYFSLNFEFFGLKKLIATHYDAENPTYKLELNEYRGTPIKTPLKQNGDFRSEESIEILKESDIVVSNPPFSLWRDYIDQLMEYDKKFLVLGNNNAITYKNIFGYIKENRLWLGYNGNKTVEFYVPDHYEFRNNNGRIDKGRKLIKVPAISWYTNLEHSKRNEEQILYREYSPEKYPHYDNYDAINIDKVRDIPMDWFGYMGVPITFMNSYNPKQFRIIGLGAGVLARDIDIGGLKADFVENYFNNGGKGNYCENLVILGYYNKEGVATIPYMRVLIQRIK